MSVFISYSHDDTEFVDLLAAMLVANNIPIWLDRWELNIGDSLTDKIQTALSEASFLCVVLSKKSVQSNWCKREINAGLLRELEDKRVVILPLLIEDCEIPLFLRDKLYADFRQDYNSGFAGLTASLSKVYNDTMGRLTDPDYITDWGIDWGLKEENFELHIDSVSFAIKEQFSILTKITIKGNDTITIRYKKYLDAGIDWFMKEVALEGCGELSNHKDLVVLIEDNNPVERRLELRDSKTNLSFKITVHMKRLGEDTGKVTVYHYGEIFQQLRNITKDKARKLLPDELMKIQKIIAEGY